MGGAARFCVGLVLLLAGCGERLWWRPPPWPKDAPVVIALLDGDDHPIGAPRLLAPAERYGETLAADGASRIWALAFGADARAPDGSPLADCGVSYSGEGRDFPPPVAQWWVDRLDAERVDSAELLPVPVGQRPPFTLHSERCGLSRDPCAGVTLETLPLDDYLVGTGAFALDDDSALVLVAQATPLGPSYDLVRFDGSQRRTVSTSVSLAFDDAAWDGRDTVYLVGRPGLHPGAIAAFDLTGAPRPVPVLGLSTENMHVSAGPTSQVYVSGADGFLRFTSGATVTERVPGGSDAADKLCVVSDDRVVVSDRNRALSFGDGSGYREEYRPSLSSPARIYDIAGNDEGFVAAGPFGTLLLRDETLHTWASLALPTGLDATVVRRVGLLRGGRIVAAVAPGLLLIWGDAGWCQLQDDVDVEVNDISVAPSGESAALLGDWSTMPPKVWLSWLRITD